MKKKLLIIGASGLFGSNFIQKNKDRYNIICNRNIKSIKDNQLKIVRLNFNNQAKLFAEIKKIKPDIILNAAGLTDVKKCELKKKEADIKNFKIIRPLVKISNNLKIKFVQISTDHIYDGKKSGSYTETDKVKPLNYYAFSKIKAEEEIQKFSKNFLIIRTNFFGWGTNYRKSFSDVIIKNLSSSKDIYLKSNIFFSPIYLGNLIESLNELIKNDQHGIFNISSNEKISKYEFGKMIARTFGFNSKLVKKDNHSDVPRPKNMALNNNKISKIISKKFFNLSQNIKNLKNDFSKPYIKKIIEFYPYGKHHIFKQDFEAIKNVLKSEKLTQGPKIEEFENKFVITLDQNMLLHYQVVQQVFI